MFDPSVFLRTPLASKCLAGNCGKRFYFKGLQPIHQIHAVMRSGEYRPRETASGPPRARAGAQPHPHNPRKQRTNPGAAGSGERFRGGKWRRGRDSNPRDGFPPTHFPGVRLRPLGHLSADPFSGTPNPVARGKTPIRQSPGQCPGLCHAQRGKSAVTCWDSSGRPRPAEPSS